MHTLRIRLISAPCIYWQRVVGSASPQLSVLFPHPRIHYFGDLLRAYANRKNSWDVSLVDAIKHQLLLLLGDECCVRLAGSHPCKSERNSAVGGLHKWRKSLEKLEVQLLNIIKLNSNLEDLPLQVPSMRMLPRKTLITHLGFSLQYSCINAGGKDLIAISSA
jgi:hypothetical protein